MLNSRCLFLNQYHQEFPNTLLRKSIGLVWVNFATFIFNCCTLIGSPTSYIDKTQATTAWSSSIVSTHVGLGFVDLVFPYKWLNNEVRGMFQCLLAFLNEVVPFSIAFMASSNVSLVHLFLVIKGLHLLTLLCFLASSYSQDGWTFSLSWLDSYYNPLRLLWSTLIIMI